MSTPALDKVKDLVFNSMVETAEQMSAKEVVRVGFTSFYDYSHLDLIEYCERYALGDDQLIADARAELASCT